MKGNMTGKLSRQINFQSIPNFRDIGGYRTNKGKTVAWRRIFRSGNLNRMTEEDFGKLKEEIRLATVIDLRSAEEIGRQGVGLHSQSDIRYHNISFITDGGNREADERRFRTFSNMGQFYMDIVRDKGFGRRIIQAMEVIAEEENHPLIFHCAVGKDRTGVLSAMLLSVIGVQDSDIIEDYTMSGLYIEELLQRISSDPKIAEAVKPLPDYFWTATPESIILFLTTLRQEYGSIPGYLELMGSDKTLVERLEKALLV
jgi:protein-tyrosine phosphatase